MEKLYIPETKCSPKVLLDPEHNTFEISGKSFPPHVNLFYRPVLNWLDAYIKSPNPISKFILNLRYLDSASSKRILDIIFKLAEMHNNRTEVLISWQYIEGKDEMLETGEEYADITNVPFEYLSYKV